MNKFIKEHGQIVLWFIFILFMLISLGMVFTHGVEYALMVFIPSVILLCPPIVKFIQQKTRLKKFVLGIISTLILIVAMFTTNSLSSAQKEEQLKNWQEKKEEREKKLEEQTSIEEQSGKSKEQKTNISKVVNKDSNSTDVDKKKTQKNKAVIRATKKSNQYFLPNQSAYNKISSKNLVVFNSEEEATKVGYKKGK